LEVGYHDDGTLKNKKYNKKRKKNRKNVTWYCKKKRKEKKI
jgi:hypothetical protein